LTSLVVRSLLKTFFADASVRAVGILTASCLRTHLAAECALVYVCKYIFTPIDNTGISIVIQALKHVHGAQTHVVRIVLVVCR